MQRLSLLGNVLKSNAFLSRKSNQWLPPLLRQMPRNFSAERDGQDPSLDPFLKPPIQGLTYGRLSGMGRNTTKADIIHFFEGCNLTAQDIKVDYNRAYTSLGIVLQFPSRAAFDMAFRLLIKKGRLYKFDKVDRGQWDLLTSYDGKVLLLQGIPHAATPEDVERFLCGCNFDASNMQILRRPGFPDPIRFALVPFPTQIQAMNAFLAKNKGFCLNSPISARLLQ
ncbi:ribosomal protein S24e family protein [Tasmannia lanceolata]|uniref:ribosomal protein S24e family protein n=1 Tax=Tasmannia lanceolata TaxID=3420 RepID=UPI0040634866